MKSSFNNPDFLFRAQKSLLALLGILVTSSVYLIYLETTNTLRWNSVTLLFISLMLGPFILSFAWIVLEYHKIKRKLEISSINNLARDTTRKNRINQLSIKEKEVFYLIINGKSNKEICATLFIEHSTLKSHINHIYKKLDIKSRKEIVYKLE